MDIAKLAAIMIELDFPKGEYAIFGGACLTAHGIRTTTDLEIFVSQQLYQLLKTSNWEERVTGSTNASYLTKVVQGIPVLAFINCGSNRWHPKVHSYLSQPEMVHDLPLMPLSEMYAWKEATGRPKDLLDLKLIDNYWIANKQRS